MKRPLAFWLALAVSGFLAGCVSRDFQSDEIRFLLKNIDREPDPSHADFTPAVYRLWEIGEPALNPTLKLMLSPCSDTRLRAYRVIVLTSQEIVIGGNPGQWTETETQRFKAFWESMGDLKYDASYAARKASVEQWNAWLRQRQQESTRSDQ